ncbi:recombinase family protein [Streptomyces sp. ISL-96]|uniref:recombinase family protein n=1 Tax=Streptomyces sp. ISL-96 TaxID=2819191 RepID=UPI001BE65017|nr:recombinase family protein [Streptomyces sp. ISL-96]MBT2489011.1 recombinase family protein [Streptomyces sp. ISL-96]
MGKRKSRTATAEARQQYEVGTEWTEADLALLEELQRAEVLLPEDAPRALLSVRLSVLTDGTTSPVRQELDLRIKAGEMGCRIVGIASDLNVSATKVPPWKRKQLGNWLNHRAPEFDVLMFWKLDRFVRRLTDLSTMIDWCLKYGKNLVSKHDAIDLTTTAGKVMVSIIGGVAEIEAINTSTRVSSLWDYTKTQSGWLVGKPTYGYKTDAGEGGRTVLVFDPNARKALLWCRKAALRRGGGVSATYMVKILIRSGLCGPGLTTTTLLRRLRNPALMGYRVEEDKESGSRRCSKLVLGKDGRPIRVADPDPIFTEVEFETLQAAVNRRTNGSWRQRASGEASVFIKVLVCVDCGTSMAVHKTVTNGRAYEYLRCQKCPSGGLGAPNPQVVYNELVTDVLSLLGDFPVQTRKYAKGAGTCTNEDRWVTVDNSRTFRERWNSGGMEAMAGDLRRVGVKCQVTRTKLPKVRAPKVHLTLLIPQDMGDRLVIKEDDFKANRSRTTSVGITDMHELLRQAHHTLWST